MAQERGIIPTMSFDEIPVLDAAAAIAASAKIDRPWSTGYYAMYSSWLGGIVTDPVLMTIPIDDHLVHRGDGVFEAIKFTQGKIFALDEHLLRLERSSVFAQLKIPGGIAAVRAIVLRTTMVAARDDGIIRIYISRGPGGFSANPYESVAPQIYIAITAPALAMSAKRKTGCRSGRSSYTAKQGWFAAVKSCNYLQNALMKKEAIDAGLDFTLSLDDRGYIAEGSTENCAIVDHLGAFLYPSFRQALRGITLECAVEAATRLKVLGVVTDIREADISVEDIGRARELIFFGTTIDAMPAAMFDGHHIGEGKPGAVALAIQTDLEMQMSSGPRLTLLRT